MGLTFYNLAFIRRKNMRNINTITLTDYLDEVFRDLNRYAVGFEPTLRMLDQARTNTNTGYPPYDLEKISENKYRLSMAIAGFTVDDIDITLQNDVLTIIGNSPKDDNKTYLYKGIAARNFRRVFYLNAWVEIISTTLADGVLTIDFQQNIPETMKPRKIAINSSNIIEV
jgi:molecular chaperone IbpA